MYEFIFHYEIIQAMACRNIFEKFGSINNKHNEMQMMYPFLERNSLEALEIVTF